jgi:hypothetical protein
LTLLPLILVLDVVDLESVVVEQDVVLRVEAVSEVVSVKDRLELSEELEGVLNAGDDLEVLVDVVLKLSLDGGNTDVEHNEVTIEHVVAVVEELVVLLSEELLALVEVVEDWLDAFQVVPGQDLELLDGSEELNELGDTSAEQIEATEDLVW